MLARFRRIGIVSRLFLALAVFCSFCSAAVADVIIIPPIPIPGIPPIIIFTCDENPDGSCEDWGAPCGLYGLAGTCQNEIVIIRDPVTGEILGAGINCGCL